MREEARREGLEIIPDRFLLPLCPEPAVCLWLFHVAGQLGQYAGHGSKSVPCFGRSGAAQHAFLSTGHFSRPSQWIWDGRSWTIVFRSSSI